MSSETQQTVELQRSVRVGRLLIVGAIAGAVIGALVTLMFEVPEGALYKMNQIAGFMLLVGGIVGLALAAILVLILNLVAKRTRGTGTIQREIVTGEGVESAAEPVAEPVGEAAPAADPESAQN